ncbi:MAG: acyltransferase [Leptolyngbyaceae bacterium]|nr:acyltransferase [Leptolyngbyaceae bacterium]
MLLRILRGIESRCRNIYYLLSGVKLHGYVWMGKLDIPRNFNAIELEAQSSLDHGVTLLCSGDEISKPKIFIGANTYINRNTFIDASLSVRIGRQCGIGPGCYITDHDHGMQTNLPPLEQPLVSKPTYIGDRVWIGANATILKGVTIGDDAVIGAGSVVTKSIPAGAIAVGNPARIIKFKPGFQTSYSIS